jgi:hypothetical protein
MKRLLISFTAALASCYPEGAYVSADAGGIGVSTPPPPAPYEAPLDCGDAVYVPGAWDWGGSSWVWQAGHCARYADGYMYVQPYYSGGIFYRGYWGPRDRYRGPYQGNLYHGRAYVPPAPVLGGSGYVPPPAPVLGGSGYVPPPAPVVGGRVAAPVPMYRGHSFVPAPPPARRR